MMRQLKRMGVVLAVVAAVIGTVRLVEYFGRAGDPAGELALLGRRGSEEVFDPALVWVPVLELAAAPRVAEVDDAGGAVGDGVVLAVGSEIVVGHRTGDGSVVGTVYEGGGGVGLGDWIGRGTDLGGVYLGERSGNFVGEGLEFGENGRVFLRKRGGNQSPILLKRPMPGVEASVGAGFKIEALDVSPDARKP